MTMRTLTLPGILPDTSVQLMLDPRTQELRAALVFPGSVYAVVWLAAALDQVELQPGTGPLGTLDIWFGRNCITLPIEARTQVEGLLLSLACEPAHAP